MTQVSQISNVLGNRKTLLSCMPSAVEDSLVGLVMANRSLVLLENERVIMRRDHNEMKDKVKLVSGGGSGNEPAHSGYVGPGMLTAAVLGGIYTAPSAHAILQTLRELGHGYADGVMLIVMNYSGDRLNFGVAMERARNEGIKVKMLIVGEDCALSETNKGEGRRGMAGIVLIHKMAGGMAEAGFNIDQIFSACQSVASTDMATITAAPSAYVAGVKVADEELELGIGIHGEHGVRRIPKGLVTDFVYTMLEHMINTESKTHITLDPSCPIVVLINNMGASSKLEENVFVMETLKQLQKRGFIVERAYCGAFLTSLEMAGFSITMLKLTSPDILKFLDAPTFVSGWPHHLCDTYISKKTDLGTEDLPLFVPGWCPYTEEEEENRIVFAMGPKLSEKSARSLLQILTFAADALIACEKQLNRYDSDGGDGDCGTILTRASEAIKSAIKSGHVNANHPYEVLETISDVIEKTMGGLSGALYSIFFVAAAKPFKNLEEQSEIDMRVWLDALGAGKAAVMRYGLADVGDRSMVDALHAAENACEEHLQSAPKDYKGALEKCAKAAREMAEFTRTMAPSVGRISESRERMLDHPDPGAYAVGIWMHAISEGVKLLF